MAGLPEILAKDLVRGLVQQAQQVRPGIQLTPNQPGICAAGAIVTHLGKRKLSATGFAEGVRA